MCAVCCVEYVALITMQDFTAFSSYMQQFSRDHLFEAFSDFHVLVFMACCDMLPLKVVYTCNACVWAIVCNST